jgi:AAA family ATP:ADP antiporter
VFDRGAALMSFFALFHTGVGWLALALQMTLARTSLRKLGLAGTVALRPIVVVVAAVVGVLEPSLWSAIGARGAHGVVHNSLFRSGYELLFTPVAERHKRPAKTIVDVGFDKIGTVAGSILILAAARWLAPAGLRALFALGLLGSLAALAVSRRLHRGYVAALEDSLRSGVVRLEVSDAVDLTTSMTLARTGLAFDRSTILREVAALRGEIPDEAAKPSADPIAEAVSLLRSGDAEKIRRALRRPDATDPALIGHLVPLLARNDVFLDILRVLRRAAPHATGQILDALLDPRQDVTVRRRIPRVLRQSESQRAADGLLLALDDTSFGVRRQAALALSRMTERAATVAVPRARVFEATLRELAQAPGSWTDEAAAAAPEESGAEARPQSPAERGLAHVFTLLSLAVEREPLRIAYWALFGGDAGLRGTALEYLENVLPEDVRAALWPHLGERARPASAPRPRQSVVEDLMRSGATREAGATGRKRIPNRD